MTQPKTVTDLMCHDLTEKGNVCDSVAEIGICVSTDQATSLRWTCATITTLQNVVLHKNLVNCAFYAAF